MGATYCCSQDERKDFTSTYLSNKMITGISNLADLQNADCKSKYKNEYENKHMLTKDKLVTLYTTIYEHFKE